MTTTRQSVGFIGLGAMGMPMARNLSERGGHQLVIHDTRPAAAEAACRWGAVAAGSAAEVARRCGVVFSMVPDDAAIEMLGNGDDGLGPGIRPGSKWVDFSSVSPGAMARATNAIARAGGTAYSATVTLGVAAAERGELAVYLDTAAAEDPEIRPLVDAFATNVQATGAAGSAKVVKLLNNLVVGVNVVAIAEALTLAAKAGVPPDRLIALVAKGSGASYSLVHHFAEAMLEGKLGPGRFPTRYILKDLSLALRMASDVGHTAVFGALAASAYRGAAGLGYGEHYYPIVHRWTDLAAGRTSDPEAAS